MKKVRLLVLAAGALLLAACAESTTAPSQMRTKGSTAKPSFDFTCPSGYITAFDDDGNPICVPAGDGAESSSRRVP